MSKFFWGIDIGKSALKAVRVEKLKGRLEIVDLELIEFEVGDGENVDRDEQVRDALNRLQQRRKMKGDRLYFSIPGQGTFNRVVSLPPVENKQIKDMVRWEAQQQIPFPIDDVIWDYQRIDKGEDFAEVEVNLFAVKKDTINNFLAMLGAAGFSVDGIQIAPLALFNFMVYDQQPAQPIVVIDMGAGSSDLVVINGTRIWIRNLTIAGDEITRKIQEKFQIPFGEAEKLKIKAAKSKHTNKIFQVMKPVLKDLVNEIHRSIGYYKSQNTDVRFAQVLLMGGATKLVGFKRFFRDNLQDYEIELIKGLSKISVSNRANVNLLQQNLASFGVAIGLAVQAAGEATNNVSLIPQEIKAEEGLRQKQKFYVIAVILLALVVAYKYVTTTQLSAELVAQGKEAKRIEEEVGGLQKEWDAAKNWGSLSADVANLPTFDAHRARWGEAVAAILSLVPTANNSERAADDKLEADKDKLWLFDLELRNEVDLVTYKAAVGQPTRPAQQRSRLVGRVGVMVVAASKDRVVDNTNAIGATFTTPLEKKLGEMVSKIDPDRAAKLLPRLKVVSEDYFWVPARDPFLLTPHRRSGAASGSKPGGAEWGPYFCQWIQIDIPLNWVDEP